MCSYPISCQDLPALALDLLASQDDQVAWQRLPLKRSPLTEVLTLPLTGGLPAAAPAAASTAAASIATNAASAAAAATAAHATAAIPSLPPPSPPSPPSPASTRWHRPSEAELLCAGACYAILLYEKGEGGGGGGGGRGGVLECIEAATGQAMWRRALGAVSGATALTPPLHVASAALTNSVADGGRLALGGRDGCVRIWRASTAEELHWVRVAPAPRRAVRGAVDEWVERLVWREAEAEAEEAAEAAEAVEVEVAQAVELEATGAAEGSGSRCGWLWLGAAAGRHVALADVPGTAPTAAKAPKTVEMGHAIETALEIVPARAEAPKTVYGLCLAASSLGYATYGGVGLLRPLRHRRGSEEQAAEAVAGAAAGAVVTDSVGCTDEAQAAEAAAECGDGDGTIGATVAATAAAVELPIGAAAVLCVPLCPSLSSSHLSSPRLLSSHGPPCLPSPPLPPRTDGRCLAPLLPQPIAHAVSSSRMHAQERRRHPRRPVPRRRLPRHAGAQSPPDLPSIFPYLCRLLLPPPLLAWQVRCFPLPAAQHDAVVDWVGFDGPVKQVRGHAVPRPPSTAPLPQAPFHMPLPQPPPSTGPLTA